MNDSHAQTALRGLLYAAARRLLGLLLGTPPGSFAIIITDETVELKFNKPPVGADAAEQLLDALHDEAANGFLRRTCLSEQECAIVLALGSEVLNGKEIAARAKVRYDAGLRILLANLVGRGVLVKTGEGYRVSDQAILKIARQSTKNLPTGQ